MTTAQPQRLAVRSRRIDRLTAHLEARSWTATLAITGTQPVNAPKSTEALIGALAACMIAGIQRESEAAGLRIDAVEATAEATRFVGERGPRLGDFHVVVTVTSPEPEAQLRPLLDALHSNGTVTNTLQLGQPIEIDYRIVPASPGPGRFVSVGHPARPQEDSRPGRASARSVTVAAEI